MRARKAGLVNFQPFRITIRTDGRSFIRNRNHLILTRSLDQSFDHSLDGFWKQPPDVVLDSLYKRAPANLQHMVEQFDGSTCRAAGRDFQLCTRRPRPAYTQVEVVAAIQRMLHIGKGLLDIDAT